MVVSTLTLWIDLLATVMAVSLGVVILALPPRSVARVSFGMGMVLFGLESSLLLISTQVPRPAWEVACHDGAVVVRGMTAPVWLLFSLYYARGPRLRSSSGWRRALKIAFGLPLAAIVVPGDLLSRVGLAAATGELPWGLGAKAIYLHGCALLTTLAILVNLEQTFRAVTGTMRWRIKFLLLGVGIVLLEGLVSNGWAILRQERLASHDLLHSVILIAGCIFIVWSMARLGLSEVEVYPSQKVIVTAATSGLVLAYGFLVGAVAWLVSQPLGHRTPAFLALIVLVGLLLMGMLLVSDRFRQRTILFCSRHFNRSRYDYRALWQTFTEQVAPASEESEYCRRTAGFVSRHLSALSVTVWLVDAHRKLSFGGSTLLTAESAEQVLSSHGHEGDLISGLEDQEGVLDLDDPGTSWADARSRIFASQFHEAGGHRLCVPLRSGGVFVGLLLIADRVGARAYTAEELDLLHTLAGEISRGLLNRRNARHLATQRELEAFQTMSAFVIHDLKNTASTLSLTLENCEKHFDNPSFREDALRAVSGCTEHIHEVVRALAVLRRDLEIKPVEADLNELVREALADLGGEQFLAVRCCLQATPRLRVDQSQIKKVLTNLLLNARDAIGEGGRVEVGTTWRSPHQVELTVRDNGCGMDLNQVRAKLFKPFNSTKKKGMGIGLYQVQAIVEAHHGEIEVESESGVGTIFRVLLPVSSKPA
ncbi:MAG: PEP-CTERM system histidine kinase PrsK [Verrucomicrobia bacterium]|jgi:putative PEP-CTERM system histidine kinase|nr:PEP-CTERM system histidine kinase PrsK [Verrucomicrobiota bacterium]